MGSPRGHAPRRRRGRTRGSRAHRGARARGRAGRNRRRPAVGARARRRRGGDRYAGGLPVQGPGDVRRRGRRVLLRARAARRRARLTARRSAAARGRRAVGQRQVVRASGRPAARARRRRAARERRLDAGADPTRRAAAARAPPRDPPARARTQRACSRSTSSRSCSRSARTRRSARSSSPRSSATARDREGRCVVVLTVRADFYGRCAAYPELSRLLGANHVLVGQMSRDELRRAIERPAQRVGLTVEPELVEALLTDVDGRPGALPLLSTALLELWSGRDGSRLRLAAYARSGGVQGAVARWPRTRSCGSTPRSRRRRASCMLRLADEDESGAIVRRRIELAELDCRAQPARSSTGSPTAACSRSPTAPSRSPTRRCCANGRGCAAGSTRTSQGRRLHRRLRDVRARVGRRRSRPRRALPRRAPRLGARVGGRPRGRAERDRARVPGREPEGERTRPAPPAHGARGRRLAARARRDRRPRRARPARQGARRGHRGGGAGPRRSGARRRPTSTARSCSPARARRWTTRSQTRSNLLAALLKSPAAIGVLRGDGDGLTSLALSPDDRTLAFVDADGTLQPDRYPARCARWRGRSPSPASRAAGSDALRFSDDGSRLAVGGAEPVILDARTQRVLAQAAHVERFIYGPALLAGRAHAVRRSSTTYRAGSLVQRFDARSGRPLGEPRVRRPRRRPRAVARWSRATAGAS